MRQPDIIFLVLDTHRADRLSCYGCPIETSPHLDALAAKATLFSQAITPAQWTIPAHASMFTGLYPSQHTMFQLNAVLPPTIQTLASRLRQAGYFTAGFSNNPLVGRLNNGLRRGFNHFINYDGIIVSRAINPNRPVNQLNYQRKGYNLFGHIQNALAQSEKVNQIRSSPLILPLWQIALKIRGNLKGNTTRSLADTAQLLIERANIQPNQPIFTFVNLMGTHTPYVPPRWAVKRFAPMLNSRIGRRFLKSINAIRSKELDFISLAKTSTRLSALSNITKQLMSIFQPHLAIDEWLKSDGLKAEYKTLLDGIYNAEVAAQDAQLGLFFKKLHTTGALDNTLLIIVADHGEHLGEKQMIGHAFGAYQELVHVPLLIYAPQEWKQGRTISSSISTRRIFHTILTAAGIATPTEETLSLLQTTSSDIKKDVVIAEAEPLQPIIQMLKRRQPETLEQFNYVQPHRAIYQHPYKVISTPENDIEFYHIYDDPVENNNLYQTLPEQAKILHEDLQNFMQQICIKTPEKLYQEEDDPMVLQRLRDLGYLE